MTAIRAASLGQASRNGLPGFASYPYRGTGHDVQEESRQRQAPVSRAEQVPGRVLAALRKLGGEGSTVEIRAVLEFDGGPVFEPGYLSTVLGKLVRRGEVTRCGREQDRNGGPARWRLGPGAGGAG